jgi:hypothetical protein
VAARALVLTLLLTGTAHATAAWRYDVQADAGAQRLTVDARFDGGDAPEFSVDDGAEPFVDAVQVEEAGAWRTIPMSRDEWRIPACARGCHLRYRFRLADAAARLQSDVAAPLGGDVVQAPPSTWLLHPLQPRAGRRYRFTVHTAAPTTFVTGVQRVGDGYEADVALLRDAPYSAFGPLVVEHRPVGSSSLELAYVPTTRALGNGAIGDAMARAAEVARRYYRRFPVERLLVLVVPADGRELTGRTLGNGGATLVFVVGEEVTAAQLAHSWVPVHELVHVAFPTVPRPQLWIDEGLATYLEPIARARAGDLDAATVWRDLVEGLPLGEPQPGDRGLDRTHTWGRTYWGGALFCLVADVAIRERTHGTRSLDDAIRAIADAGGNIGAAWPLERALAVGDAAIGVPVLVPLRDQWGARAVDVDLPALWKRLGVRMRGRTVEFDDSAPLAALRRAITTGP